jgi:NAD(P)-dependent dehydrogenase (short-subunit alcohol dehydrogenase family)
MKIEGSVALVTGGNRGLGRAYARGLVERGAKVVYAGARDPRTVTDSGLIAVALDVTDPASIAAAAQQLSEVNLVINNAGITRGGPLLRASVFEDARAEFETNVLGTLAVSRAFAPILGANGGGALVNMLSVLSWVTFPSSGTYSASKSAAWSLTNALRQELQAQRTQVLAVHAGLIDTDMVAEMDAPKTAPELIAARALDALEAGLDEVLTDDVSAMVKSLLSSDPKDLYAALGQ